MACPRGAASPNAYTQRKLFSASSGYCQNPECPQELFVELPGKRFHIAEIAHVFAANDRGPRADAAMSEEERGAFDNLILLCPKCHTIVDKAPDVYTDTVILRWKREHREKLRSLYGVTVFETRGDARNAIEGLLRENHQIFQDYGPHIEEANDPESGAAERWGRKVLLKIIPSSRRVLAQLQANERLLSRNELVTLERFRQHIDDLEARHIEGYREGASQFPQEMSRILMD